MSGKPYILGRPVRTTGNAPAAGRIASQRGVLNPNRSRSSSSRAKCLTLLGAIALGAVIAGPAKAGLTHVGASKTAGEATAEQILSRTYGGTFVPSGNGGGDFTNGSVTAARIDDDGGAEQRWNVNVTSARAVAAFSGYNQSFGQIVGGAYKPLFDVSGRGFDVSGSADLAAGARPAGGFTFARAGDDRVLHERVFSSRPADNHGGEDHLVSYRVSGTGAPGQTYLLFWEDAIGRGSDFDHNDLVVELKTAGGEALLIPLPSAAWTGLSGLGALALLRGTRRLCRRAA